MKPKIFIFHEVKQKPSCQKIFKKIRYECYWKNRTKKSRPTVVAKSFTVSVVVIAPLHKLPWQQYFT